MNKVCEVYLATDDAHGVELSLPVPLTGVMGQEIAGLVPYSGAGLRTIVTILNVAVVSAYLVWWAKRCQKNTAIYEADFGGGAYHRAPRCL